MADKDINERQVFAQEIPSTVILICHFHVLRTFNREITAEKMGISSAQRHTALELLQKLVYSSSEQKYESQMEVIRQTCPRQVYEYLINNWHSIRNEWVLGLKLCEGAMMNTTNNRLESFNQKLKQVVKLYSSLVMFFDKFLSLINTLRNERDHRGSIEIQKVSVSMKGDNEPKSAEDQYSALLTGYANNFVQGQIARARKQNQQYLTTANDKLFDGCIELCTESCDCCFNKSMGLPCHHIFLARLLVDINLYDSALCDKRWTRSYYRQNTRLTKSAMIENQPSNNQVTTTHIEQSSKKTLSANQKYKKAFLLTEKLASLCAEVGMTDFEERMKTLHNLVEAWQDNTEVVINQVNQTGTSSMCREVHPKENTTSECPSKTSQETPVSTSRRNETVTIGSLQDNVTPTISGTKTYDVVDSNPHLLKVQSKVDSSGSPPASSRKKPACQLESNDSPTMSTCSTSIPSTSGIGTKINEMNTSNASGIKVQEFLHILCDTAAAIRAETGQSLVEEEEVHIKAEDLLPHVTILLNHAIQAKAKKHFSSDAWKTVESTLNVLEDLHLKYIKEKEFPPFVSNKKGCGKKSLKVTNSNNITSSENVGNDNGINWVEVAKENIDKLRKFVDSHEPDKCLPSVGESITRYYEDRTKSLSEKERTLLIYYLCRTFKKLRIPTTKVTYLLHDTIGFLMNGCKEYDIQQEESEPVQPKPTEHHFTAEKIINISDIKLPAKLRMKGRPKGSNLTVIGLSKKSKTNRKSKPFFKRCNKEKQKVILEWIVGRELAEMATNGHTIEKADIEEKSLPTACLDSYVDMDLVKQFFSSDGWNQVTSFIQRKRDKPDYSCDVCKHSIDFDAVNVVCDSCLNIFHLQCVQLKNVPKVKHWFCKNCK